MNGEAGGWPTGRRPNSILPGGGVVRRVGLFLLSGLFCNAELMSNLRHGIGAQWVEKIVGVECLGGAEETRGSPAFIILRRAQ